jgi:hypothetical protein
MWKSAIITITRTAGRKPSSRVAGWTIESVHPRNQTDPDVHPTKVHA